MKHPKLKAAMAEALKVRYGTVEDWAEHIIASLPESVFTPTREQVLRWEGLPELLDQYEKSLQPEEIFIAQQLSALTPEPAPPTYPLKTAVGPVQTEEMAERVYDRLIEMGKRDGAQQIGWGVYRASTCYEIEYIRFGHINTYSSQGYTIITPEEFLGIVLVTEDGVEITDTKQKVWHIMKAETSVWADYMSAALATKHIDKAPWFSTREAAEASVNQDLADLKRIVSEGQKLIDKPETK